VLEIKTSKACYGTRAGLVSTIGARFDELLKDTLLAVWDSWVRKFNWIIRKEEECFYE
jgi:hypothetical protein